MDAIIPRYDLPDTWAGKGACPVCRVRGRLAVVHQTVTPDQMWCGACDAAFEVESGGAHLRLVRLPVSGAAAPEQLLEVWVLPSELPALLAAPAPDASAAAPAEAAPPAEVAPAPPEPSLTTALNLPPKSKLSDSIRELLYGPDETGEPPAGHAPAAEPPAAHAATLLAHLRAEPPVAEALVAEALVAAPTPAAEPPAPASDAATLLAQLRADLPVAEALVAAPTPAEPPALDTIQATLAPVEAGVLEPHSAALLSALLADLPAASAPADEATFLDSLAAQAITPPATPAADLAPADSAPVPAVEPPPPAGDAAALLAQLLQDLPATAAPADEANFLDALAAGAAPAVTAADTAPTAKAQPPGETALVAAGDQTLAVPEVVIIVPEPPDPAELAARALQLYKLGNSLTLIQAALERTGASPDQVALAMREVRAQDQRRLARHARTYQVLAGAGLVLLLVVILVVAFSSLRPTTAAPAGPSITPGGPTITPGGPTLTPTPVYNPIIALINLVMPSDVKIVNGNTPTPGPTSAWWASLFPDTPTPLPETATAAAATAAAETTAVVGSTAVPLPAGVPDWVVALVPADLPAAPAATPSVEQTGPPAADCPFTADLAAPLFGGSRADWHFDANHHAWYLALTTAPIAVRVPVNMSAVYLVAGAPAEFRTVPGPATITKVNFIVISCAE